MIYRPQCCNVVVYKVSFSSLAAICVTKDVTNKGKFERDQIHEKSKEL
jgi:hypothetical protein